MQTQSWRYRLVAKKLRQGAVIAYPTEGVWGLGCLPESQSSVLEILALKRREWQKGLIMACGSIEQALPYMGELTDRELATLEDMWPGPVTVVLPKSDKTPLWVSGEFDSVAIRVSSHPVIQGICAELGQPIISTSANPAGKAPALTRLRLMQYFGDQLDEIVPGSLGGLSGPSKIVELRENTVIRDGGK